MVKNRIISAPLPVAFESRKMSEPLVFIDSLLTDLEGCKTAAESAKTKTTVGRGDSMLRREK